MPIFLRRWQVISTAVVVVLSALTSLVGLLRPDHYNDAAAMLPQTRIEDGVILLLGVPLLALGLRYATRGSRRGQVLWLGSLAFMLYIWASKATLLRFNDAFLAYIVLFSLSLFTLVGGLVDLDARRLREAVEGRVSTRVFGGYLLVAAVGLGFLWLSDVLAALLSGTGLHTDQLWGQMTNATYVLDLGVVVPALAVAGVWFLRGRAWGYALGGVLLVFSGPLGAIIASATVVNFVNGVPMSIPAFVLSILPPVLGGLLGVRFLVALGGRTAVPTEGHETGSPT